jgi:mitochondrial inner membrane protease subunit 1
MLPTMAIDGEVAIESILAYRLSPSLTRGDLVTLVSPLDPSRIICKRILGLAGDVVCVDPTGLKAPSSEHVLVPKGHMWLVGDNAAVARDSRDYGPVSTALIRGKLVARVSSKLAGIILFALADTSEPDMAIEQSSNLPQSHYIFGLIP